jgi:hypothetical protein
MYRALAESIHLFEVGLTACHRPEDRVLVDKYMAALAPMLADAVRGETVLHRLKPMDRLLGQTWLHDQAPFEPAIEQWRVFRGEYKSLVLRSMTVNERLSALNLMDDYDRVVALKDKSALSAALTEAEVDEASIHEILRRHHPVA